MGRVARSRSRARARKRLVRLGEVGAAAVEFALVVPALAMLLMGTITVGLAYSDHVALTNAVREGARLGATAPVNPASPGDWASSVVAQTVATYANANNPLTTNDVCAKMIKYDASGNPTTAIATSQLGTSCNSYEPTTPTNVKNACVVKVWAAHRVNLFWVLGGKTIALTAKSVSMYDRDSAC